MPYGTRSFKRLLAVARESSIQSSRLDRFEFFVTSPHESLKERDAVALLRRMASGEDQPLTPSIRIPRTLFFERLFLEVERETCIRMDKAATR